MITWIPGQLKAPALLLFAAVFSVIVTVTLGILNHPDGNFLSWYTGVVWTLPVPIALLSLAGAIMARRHLKRTSKARSATAEELLIVTVPTVGRHDVLPALTRSVRSFVNYLPSYFPNLLVEVVVEDDFCEAREEIEALVATDERIMLVVVPKDFTTSRGTQKKCRANAYALEARITRGQATDNVWVLHMDDDTAVHTDTAREIARFIGEQRAVSKPKHLAQGVLTYPRQFSKNHLLWLADSIRPFDDIGRFVLTTGGGTPIGGVHGELLLVRSSVEAEIGWNFSSKEITEDAYFAFLFGQKFPGMSGWFAGRCYGASPETVKDFVKQRRRWATGLIRLVTTNDEDTRIPLRMRVFMALCLTGWVIGPLQHVAVVLTVAFVLGISASPAIPILAVCAAITISYSVWGYVTGLATNAHAGGMARSRFRDKVMVVVMIPFFTALEAIGCSLGIFDRIRSKYNFVVITKTS